MEDKLSDIVIETAKTHKKCYIELLENNEVTVNDLITELALYTAYEQCYSKCSCLININPVKEFIKEKLKFWGLKYVGLETRS